MAEKILSHVFLKRHIQCTFARLSKLQQRLIGRWPREKLPVRRSGQKITLHVSYCLRNSHKVFLKTGEIDIVTINVTQYTRFACSCDIRVDIVLVKIVVSSIPIPSPQIYRTQLFLNCLSTCLLGVLSHHLSSISRN